MRSFLLYSQNIWSITYVCIIKLFNEGKFCMYIVKIKTCKNYESLLTVISPSLLWRCLSRAIISCNWEATGCEAWYYTDIIIFSVNYSETTFIKFGADDEIWTRTRITSRDFTYPYYFHSSYLNMICGLEHLITLFINWT